MQVIRRKITKATSTPKGRIIFASILFTLILAMTGAIVYWQTHKKKIIREKLESVIEDKSAGLYAIRYETLEMDELTGFLSLTNLSLNWDSAKYENMKKLGITTTTLFNIHIPEIRIEGVKTPRALIDKEIRGQKLEIKNPSIEIIYTLQGKDSSRKVPTSEIYQLILGNLKEIQIDTVTITGAQIKTSNLKTAEAGIEIRNALVQLVDVKIDSMANQDTTRLLFAKQVSVACEELSWTSDNKLYQYNISDISLGSLTNSVQVGSFAINPQAGEDRFVKSLPAQDDRFDFSFGQIQIRNINFAKLLNEEIIADSVLIGSASYKIYRDLNIPRDKKNRVGTYPHQVINRIPVPIHIGKLMLSNAYLEYKERSHITGNPGSVRFHDVHATIHNLTNKKEMMAKDNIMRVDISSRFLDKAPFRTTWLFYLGNSNGRFDLKGTLGSIHAKDINQLTEPMGPARIEDGEIKSIHFNLKGNNYSMNGNVQFVYKNLKVALLEKDKGAKEWDKKSLTSFVANLFIKNSNPKDEDEEPRVSSVTHERDTNRSIFNLAWKTLFKAIKETIGIRNNKE